MGDPNLRIAKVWKEPELETDGLDAPALRTMVRNLEGANRNLREELAAASGWEPHARYWESAWVEFIGLVGDAMHRAKAKKKGRKFVTILEMSQLLKSAVPEEPDDA